MHKPADLRIQFKGGSTEEASSAATLLMNDFSKAISKVDAPLTGPERGLVGTFILWLLEEGELDTEQLQVTRTAAAPETKEG